MNSKHIFARLLANENITVVHGNFSTASFDVKTRVLNLPLWNNMEVYDLLLGHEVGHALYTPFDGWHKAMTANPDISKDIYNVVEDVRIERLMQDKYPGLVSSFKRGYKHMLERDFFLLHGDTDITCKEYSFLDRMNISAKLRSLVNVEFTAYEQAIVDKAAKAHTFDEVIEISKEIHEYIKSKRKENKESDDKKDELNENPFLDHDFVTTPVQNDNATKKQDDLGDEDIESESDGLDMKNDNSETGMKETDSENKAASPNYIHHGQNSGGGDNKLDENKSMTLKALEDFKQTFVERDAKGKAKFICQGISKEQMEQMFVSYDELRKQRNTKPSHALTVDFNSDTKNSVANMVKEFELRKAAYQFKKASISKTGTLDVDKLHSYKTSEDLFLRSVKLGEFKDHGMVMLVDYSGSMRYTLKSVLKQVLILATFCKKVNIPFEIYGFTSMPFGRSYSSPSNVHQKPDVVNTSSIHVFQLLSSDLSKEQYKEAFGVMVAQSQVYQNKYYFDSQGVESLGDTPLNESLMVMHNIIRKFKIKHNHQKIVLVTLTDGGATWMKFNTPIGYGSPYGEIKIKVGDKFYDYSSSEFTSTVIKSLKEQGVCDKVLSFSLVEPGALSSYLYRYMNKQATSKNKDQDVARKKFRDEGILTFDNVDNYDRIIMLKQDNGFLDDHDEMDITTTSTKTQIAKQFKKYAGSKKNVRAIAVKFSEIIA